MIVFKGCMLIVKKNIGMILMYFGIFAFLAILIANEGGNDIEKGFTAKKVKIILVDKDQSELSGLVAKYLKKYHKVTEAEHNKRELYEALYYQKSELVVSIPEGMEENAGTGKKLIEYTQAPGSFSGIYVEQQITQLISGIRDYQSVGYGAEEAYRKIADSPQAKVSVQNVQGVNSRYSNFFRCVPYMFIAGLGTSLAMVIFYMRRREVRNRMMVSAVPLARQNLGIVLSVLLVGILMLLLTLVLAVLCYGMEFLQNGILFYYLMNLFIDMLLALAMAFLVGLLSKKEVVVNMCFVPLSLAFSFLGGVFMPIEYLSEKVQIVSKFIPVYWYEVVNNLLMRYSSISGAVKTQIWQAFGLQMLFVAAIFAVGLVIAKYQQQER